ncbi:iron-containing alcohol dehydrogenase [Vibrio vulnificus]
MLYKTERFFVNTYHALASTAFPRMPVPVPNVLNGEKSLDTLAEHLKSKGIQRPVIFTDSFFCTLPSFQLLIDALEKRDIDYKVFNEIQPDPSYAIVEKGIAACHEHNYDCAIAIGGGSSIDGTKMINGCAKHNLDPRKITHGLMSMLQLRRKGAYFVAIPTTAGTGSEATTVTVVTDEKTNQKNALVSYGIVPDLAVFDSRLTMALPPHITAATGMDALTHAMESFMSTYATKQTDEMNLKSIQRIFEFLPRAYKNGTEDDEARSEMALASFDAGKAFSKTLLGWAHGISHQLGAFYKIPHGLGCAIALPHVLQFALPKAAHRLAIIADALGLKGTTQSEKAQAVVDAVFELNQTLDIESQFNMLEEKHVSQIARNIIKEGNLAYPSHRNFDSYAHLESFLLERKSYTHKPVAA